MNFAWEKFPDTGRSIHSQPSIGAGQGADEVVIFPGLCLQRLLLLTHIRS